MASTSPTTNRRAFLGAIALGAAVASPINPLSSAAASFAAAPASEWQALAGLPALLDGKAPDPARWTMLVENVDTTLAEWKRLTAYYEHMHIATIERAVENARLDHASAIFALLEEPAHSPAALLHKLAVARDPEWLEDVQAWVKEDLRAHGVLS